MERIFRTQRTLKRKSFVTLHPQRVELRVTQPYDSSVRSTTGPLGHTARSVIKCEPFVPSIKKKNLLL